jgi:polynucleotide 5'-kinase involved in rRNA processing
MYTKEFTVMRLKGLIRLFTTPLLLVSIFQFYLIFNSKKIEKKLSSKIECRVISKIELKDEAIEFYCVVVKNNLSVIPSF